MILLIELDTSHLIKIDFEIRGRITMKRLTWVVCFLLLFVGIGTAQAKTHKVKKGEWLSKISTAYGCKDYTKIKRVGDDGKLHEITNKSVIEIGWILDIPVKGEEVKKTPAFKDLKPETFRQVLAKAYKLVEETPEKKLVKKPKSKKKALATIEFTPHVVQINDTIESLKKVDPGYKSFELFKGQKLIISQADLTPGTQIIIKKTSVPGATQKFFRHVFHPDDTLTAVFEKYRGVPENLDYDFHLMFLNGRPIGPLGEINPKDEVLIRRNGSYKPKPLPIKLAAKTPTKAIERAVPTRGVAPGSKQDLIAKAFDKSFIRPIVTLSKEFSTGQLTAQTLISPPTLEKPKKVKSKNNWTTNPSNNWSHARIKTEIRRVFGTDAPTMIQIAYGESYLRTKVVGDKKTSFWHKNELLGRSIGVLQIRTGGRRHGIVWNRAKQNGMSVKKFEKALQNPEYNIRIAKKLFDARKLKSGNGFLEWGAYTNGSYRKYAKYARS